MKLREIEIKIKETLDLMYSTMSGMHDLQKQHNIMIHDLYERIALLEEERKKEKDESIGKEEQPPKET